MKSNRLYFNTVKPVLKDVLEQLMSMDEFDGFRLVGGTSLSLRYGHRMSDDIDLFADAQYGSIDFNGLQQVLCANFPYCNGDWGEVVGFGASYMIGNSIDNCVKLDLFYTDPFIKPIECYGKIRMASVEDIIAMKMDVISQGGRKKDFWDLHFLHRYYDIKEMLDLYEARYPYGATRKECVIGLNNFAVADGDPDPVCLQNKMWQLIKLDFVEWIEQQKNEVEK